MLLLLEHLVPRAVVVLAGDEVRLRLNFGRRCGAAFRVLVRPGRPFFRLLLLPGHRHLLKESELVLLNGVKLLALKLTLVLELVHLKELLLLEVLRCFVVFLKEPLEDVFGLFVELLLLQLCDHVRKLVG